MISSKLENLGGNKKSVWEARDEVFFMENVTGVIASGSLGCTEACGCNKASLCFICSCCYGGKHFSSKNQTEKTSLWLLPCYKQNKLLAGFSVHSLGSIHDFVDKKCFCLCPPLNSVKLLQNPSLFSGHCHYSMDLKVNLSPIVLLDWDHSNRVLNQ